MKTSQRGIDRLKSLEAKELEAYPDPASALGRACAARGLKMRDYRQVPGWPSLSGAPWTIGWGATGPQITQGTVWTDAKAESDLLGRISAIDGILTKVIVPVLNQNQWDALVCLVYNIGQAAFRGSTLLRLINQRDFKGAAEEFLKWDKEHRNGVLVEDPGLLRRREAERTLFLS